MARDVLFRNHGIFRNADIDSGPHVAWVCGHRFNADDRSPRLIALWLMTIRITSVHGRNKMTIRVEGRLAAEEVEVLQKEIHLVSCRLP